MDFVCLDTKLIVEVDGGQHLEQSASDAKRTAWLEGRGFRLLRYWNDQVLKEPEAVTEAIWNAMNPPAQPSPTKGGREN